MPAAIPVAATPANVLHQGLAGLNVLQEKNLLRCRSGLRRRGGHGEADSYDRRCDNRCDTHERSPFVCLASRGECVPVESRNRGLNEF
jgi:hypothetical protein